MPENDHILGDATRTHGSNPARSSQRSGIRFPAPRSSPHRLLGPVSPHHRPIAVSRIRPFAHSRNWPLQHPYPLRGCNSDLAQYSNTPSLWGGFDFADSCLGDLLSRRDASDFVTKGRIGLCPEGMHRTLARRDWMIVARQFIAWHTPEKGEPARRDGVSWATPHIRRPW